MISIRNLTRRYGDVVAVDDVSLEIERGEVVGLLGHNGAGKTTVMKILTGFLEPTSGSVRVGGVDVLADRAGVQRQIGYLPENAPLYPELAVQQYLQMMAELRGVPADRVDAAVLRAAEDTALTDRLADPIHTLSKGYRQRVGIAQAIVHAPEVLVLDEPTNGLDPVQIQAIRDLVRRLAERTTIILSTHILQEIEAVCDRVVVMIQGRIAADGGLSELLSSRSVSLSVDAADAGAVSARLSSLDGVESVRGLGDDADNPGFHAFEIGCRAGANPVPALVEAAHAAGWRVAAAAPHRDTLETVFARLHEEQAAARAAEDAA
jgi:ABC-2 type transport system ATP-binding protein